MIRPSSESARRGAGGAKQREAWPETRGWQAVGPHRVLWRLERAHECPPPEALDLGLINQHLPAIDAGQPVESTSS